MLSRRIAMLSGAALLAGWQDRAVARPRSGFVTRDGKAFRIDGRRYRYAGANLWYGAYLAADAPLGDRHRLRREFDGLAELGITNLRVLASSELSPLRNSITPAFRTSDGNYNSGLLGGLDFLLAEMGKRGLRAVLYLTNFWEWSGGMMTYLYWVNGGRYLDMNDPAHPWPEFPDFNAAFYSNSNAVSLYHDYVRVVVTRTNSITGKAYRDDPTIMAWQLANEPRPGGSEAVGRQSLPSFYAWIAGTAGLIKSLDPNHLVCTGSEGLKGCIESADCVIAEHRPDTIDYLTTHIWPLNWGWIDSADLPGTYAVGEAKVKAYIATHITLAEQLGKPLVFEEFGFPRDSGLFDPGSPVTFRDRFYRLIYEAVQANARAGGPLAGSNFWAWAGQGRAAHADHRFQRGDTSYVGDPPHEPQGWYSVFDSDDGTKTIIREHAAALGTLS